MVDESEIARRFTGNQVFYLRTTVQFCCIKIKQAGKSIGLASLSYDIKSNNCGLDCPQSGQPRHCLVSIPPSTALTALGEPLPEQQVSKCCAKCFDYRPSQRRIRKAKAVKTKTNSGDMAVTTTKKNRCPLGSHWLPAIDGPSSPQRWQRPPSALKRR
jgi:hypothetical protein